MNKFIKWLSYRLFLTADERDCEQKMDMAVSLIAVGQEYRQQSSGIGLKGDPWATYQYAEILDLKDGWVRYSIFLKPKSRREVGILYRADVRSPVRAFLNEWTLCHSQEDSSAVT